MELLSCDSCGVVLDARKLTFPKDIYTDQDEIDDTKAIWKNRDYLPFVQCPVCHAPVTKE